MNERLLPRIESKMNRPKVVPLVARRAVELCGSCPLAAICATKDPENCAPTYEKLPDVAGNSYELPAQQVSYRTALLDDSIGTVFAKLEKKQPPKPEKSQKRSVEKITSPKQPLHIGKALAELAVAILGFK